jgi:hypothetical protein
MHIELPTHQGLQLRELQPVLVSQEVVHDGDLIVDVNRQLVAFNQQPAAAAAAAAGAATNLSDVGHCRQQVQQLPIVLATLAGQVHHPLNSCQLLCNPLVQYHS